MVNVPFSPSARPTLGVEWELALVDPISGDLLSVADAVFEQLDKHPGHRVHRELLLNTVELVTGICDNVGDAMADLTDSMRTVRSVTDPMGVNLFSAGMHPFASWDAQRVTESERYETLIDRTQFWGRQMLIYGIHMHVGMPDRDRVLPVLNSLLRYFPHLQALSASSPFYDGQDTGYASNRALLFQQLPTAGLPFQFDTWPQYERYVTDLTTTGVIDLINEIRWDIRPSPSLGTIEVRICDAVTTYEELEAIVALVHCLIVYLDGGLAGGRTLPTLPPWHVQENKWRAARYGMDAIIIQDEDNNEQLVTDDLRRILPKLEPIAAHLNCERELAGVYTMMENKVGYQRQRQTAEEDGLAGVVSSVVDELTASLDRQP